jgi:hypothetical protein
MIQGIFASNQGIVGDRVGDFASVMLQINPTGTALFLALTSGMAKESAGDTVFNWFEDVHQSMRSAITGAVTNVATTIPVADGSLYVKNQLIMCMETGEQMIVTGSNGNNLTVIRGSGGTTPTAMTSAMFIQSIGNAQSESSDMPTAITQQGIARFNVTQIFRNSWAVSGTAKAINFRTGGKVAKNKRDCAMYQAEDIERSFLWARKDTRNLDNNPYRVTDGLISQLEQYGAQVTTANSAAPGGGQIAGQLNFNDFEDFMRIVFSKNVKGQPNERLCFGGDIALSQFNKMARLDGTYEIMKEETTYGLQVNTIVSQFGRLKILTHPLMNENPIWQKELYVIHPGGIKKRVLREPNEEGYDKNGQRIDAKDADQGVITAEMGLQVGAAQTMGIYRNISKGVKSS